MNIAVFGAKGRVGSKVVEIAKQRGHTVTPIDIKNNKLSEKNQLISPVGEDLETNISVRNIKSLPNNNIENDSPTGYDCCVCVAEESNKIDVVIDFSTAAATQDVCNFCRQHRCALVSGVTGRNEEQQQLIDCLSSELPVVCKSNFSVGVNMLHRLSEIVAKELADWDCEIVEIHRRGKLDSPSGTAKSLASTIAQQKNFKRVTTHALRCGSNFGKHEIVFATNGESLTLTHQAENVEIFALGSVLECEKLLK